MKSTVTLFTKQIAISCLSVLLTLCLFLGDRFCPATTTKIARTVKTWCCHSIIFLRRFANFFVRKCVLPILWKPWFAHVTIMNTSIKCLTTPNRMKFLKDWPRKPAKFSMFVYLSRDKIGCILADFFAVNRKRKRWNRDLYIYLCTAK